MPTSQPQAQATPAKGGPPPLQLFVNGNGANSADGGAHQHRLFEWRHDFGLGIEYSLAESLPIPLPGGVSADDLLLVLAARHRLPDFAWPTLLARLSDFVSQATAGHFDRLCQERRAAGGPADAADDFTDLVEHICSEFRLVKSYPTLVQPAGVQANHDDPQSADSVSSMSSAASPVAAPDSVSAASSTSASASASSADEQTEFRRAYLQLVNSTTPGKAAKLIRIERAMAKQVADLLASAGVAMRQLSAKQQAVMEEAVAQSGSRYTDEDINRLNAQHVANLTGEAQRWRNELVMLKDRQKAAHRQLVACQLTSLAALDPRLLPAAAAASIDIGSTDAAADSAAGAAIDDAKDEYYSAPYLNPIAWEESFTISVGTQLKTQHNLRLLSANLKYLLSPNSAADRLQSALSLYSDSLSAFVLLSSRDQACNPHLTASLRFSDLCERSADFHFDDYGRQMEAIWRRINESNPSSAAGPNKPSVGDVFITRHSNLNGAQLVFHLVTESGDCPELTSQHPVIAQGLRRIVRTALAHDVNCLTLPLLLTTHLSEEMTITWCQRRAELVLKTIKGFLVEYITWQSHRTPRCFQFLVPPGLSESMLQSFSACIQSIFSLSNVALMK